MAAHGNLDAKALAFQNLSKVCRIGTHLFHFAEYVNALRGWGRGLRGAVGSARTLLKQISTRTCCFTVCPNFPEKAVTAYRA